MSNSGKEINGVNENTLFATLSKMNLPINDHFPANNYNLPNFGQNPFQGVFSALEIYKSQYFRLLRENQLLQAQLNAVIIEKTKLQAKYNTSHQNHPEMIPPRQELDHQKKRYRRSAQQIERSFACFHDGCTRSYGTEASLIQHIKIKHPQIINSKNYEMKILSLRKQVMGIKGYEGGRNEENMGNQISENEQLYKSKQNEQSS